MRITTFNSTKSGLLASLTAFALFALVGCGGNGTGSLTSPFTGTWAGTYSSTGQSGTANVVIGANGAYVGSGFDNTAQQNYSIQGAITSSGIVTGTLTEGATTVNLNGNWTINS